MRRAYKFRMRPSAKQHIALGECLGAHCEIYNAALQERRDAYERCVRRAPTYFGHRPNGPVTYGTQSAQLSEIRSLRPDIARWSFSSQQTTLRRLNRAFEAFFRRCRSGCEPGYPRFKPARRFESVEWPKDGDACRWHPEASRVYLKGIGHVKVTVHRKVEGRVKTILIKREGRRWFVVLSCDEVPEEPLEPTGTAVGLDVGIASFATTSDGTHFVNPRHGQVGAARLVRAQRVLAKKQLGSNNRRAAREAVAARHRKVANQRRDFHHKIVRELVQEFDVICVENLAITSMVRSAKGTKESPGTNVAAKSGLNRSITDAGWGQFRSILCAKAEEAGRTVIAVNPQYTSQKCAECGHTDLANRVSQAVFRCMACGHQADADADANAARNILRAGLARLVAQAA